MPKFRKKPIVVEAERFRENNSPWPEGVCLSLNGNTYFVETANGFSTIQSSGWVLTDPETGDKWPITDEFLKKTYEPVED